VSRSHLYLTLSRQNSYSGDNVEVIATVAMGLAAGAGLMEAATLANQAAGIAVARFGPTAVTQHDLLESPDA
jgi:bifunctional ADP-heptose synthase (sugar kinase/adenylyltransferase)